MYDEPGNREPVKITWKRVERVTHLKYLETSIVKTNGARDWKTCSGVLYDGRPPAKLKGNIFKTPVKQAQKACGQSIASDTSKRRQSGRQPLRS